MGDPGRKPTVSDTEILRIFVVNPDPVFLASELTDELDMSRQGIHNRLDELEERGYLNSKTAGGRRMFWVTQEGRAFFAESEES
jgi:DNA-binding MarR family transcriptional regulator